jgi:hypothetical protein
MTGSILQEHRHGWSNQHQATESKHELRMRNVRELYRADTLKTAAIESAGY